MSGCLKRVEGAEYREQKTQDRTMLVRRRAEGCAVVRPVIVYLDLVAESARPVPILPRVDKRLTHLWRRQTHRNDQMHSRF